MIENDNRLMKLLLVVFLAITMGCSSGSSDPTPTPGPDPTPEPDPGSDPAPSASWVISVRSDDTGSPLNPALLGHYELSGALYEYSNVSGLMSAMDKVGFSEWRVGSGRWEQATELLPTLTNGDTCPYDSGIFSEGATNDIELMVARDWFRFTDGSEVSVADTELDSRYNLDYIRSVIDTAEQFGATPYVSIDHMPRALSINQTANRVNCGTTFMNAVSNNQPKNRIVFAKAVTGLVKRVVEGTGSQTGRERPRNVVHWEVWNEPEYKFFWEPGWQQPSIYLDMAVPILVFMDQYRTESGRSELKFGLGSFAVPSTAVEVINQFGASDDPVPMDFISFHGYDDDPLVIVEKVEQVTDAAQSSTHYKDIEIVLAEWGPDLATRTGDQDYAAGMGPPLHAATVIAMGVAAGLDRAHCAIFYDYHSTLALGLVNNAGQPRTLYRGYEMMAKVIKSEAVRLSPTGITGGKLDDGMGAVLVSRDGEGTIRVLIVNRNIDQRTVRVDVDNLAATPTTGYVFDSSDDPIDPLRTFQTTTADVTIPGNALMVLEY